jgi:RNA polymerase sigma-70 factor (ECF subfamily)
MKAIEEIYDEYHERILRYLSKFVADDEAEDLAQEVLDKIRLSIGGFRGSSKLSTWIYRIATNHALDKLRSPEYREKFISIEETAFHEICHLPDQTGSHVEAARVEIDYIRKEMSECVREFVDKLPADYKAVILLSELEEFSNREIAGILQVSLETVKIRLHRAKAMLKKSLEKGCIFYHNGLGLLACDRKPVSMIHSKVPPSS